MIFVKLLNKTYLLIRIEYNLKFMIKCKKRLKLVSFKFINFSAKLIIQLFS